MLLNRIVGAGNREPADVQNNALSVSLSNIPADTGDIITLPFVQPVSINNDGVSFDLRVDGTVDPVDAFILSDKDFDTYITAANIIIEGQSAATLQDFGSVSGGLTNGILTYFENDGVRIPISSVPLKRNIDFLRVGTLTPTFGQDDSAWRIQLSGTGNSNKTYNPVWDLKRLSAGLGARLIAGEDQKLGITIQDDLTVAGVQGFSITLLGFRSPVRRV